MKDLLKPTVSRSSFSLVLAWLTLGSLGAGVHADAASTLTDIRAVPPVWLVTDSPPAADDTGRNVRDRNAQTLTPMDQSNDPADLKLTRNIRKALMADDSLSTTAQNIKIITAKGKVTLRGPVATAKEKAVIGKKAQKFAKGRVDNQLEVTAR